jgi:hypothetical protein
MKLVVCAKSDHGRFIGLPSATGYIVFTADHADAIHPGDILSNPTWDEESVPAPNVRNMTSDDNVKVRLERWGLTLPEACDLLEQANTPVTKWHPPWPGPAM